MPDINRVRLPFAEQIAFFRQKMNLPTQRYDDIKGAAHDRAFVVAGAQSADLLADLRYAVDAGIAKGDTLQDFRKNFASIVADRGWTGFTGDGSKAGIAWRTRVIYNTNVSVSHAAGRWQQLNDPELLALRPFWRYIHSDIVAVPRPQHLAWNGLTLRHDHIFWQTHFAPNGIGCRCRITAVSAPKDADSTAPPDGWNVRNSKGLLPGIDKGWDYAPGAKTDQPLRDLVQKKLITWPPAIGQALTRDVTRWISGRADVSGFARDALENRQLNQDVWLGFVENKAIDRIVGADLSDYLVLLPTDTVRHVERTHGRDGGDQRPPTPGDYSDIARWLADGKIEPANSEGGYPRVKVTYTRGDETIYSVWEVRTGKRNRALVLISMWVKR